MLLYHYGDYTEEVHLFSSRTQKLSSSGPIVVAWSFFCENQCSTRKQDFFNNPGLLKKEEKCKRKKRASLNTFKIALKPSLDLDEGHCRFPIRYRHFCRYFFCKNQCSTRKQDFFNNPGLLKKEEKCKRKKRASLNTFKIALKPSLDLDEGHCRFPKIFFVKTNVLPENKTSLTTLGC